MAVGLCVAWPSHGLAQAVALDMSACKDPAPAVVRGLLAVELRERLLKADAAPPPDAQVVEVECTGDAAQLRLRGTPTDRKVALSSVPRELRARLLALAAAELARPQPTAASAAALAEAAGPTRPQTARADHEVAATRAAQPPAAALPASAHRAAQTYQLWAGLQLEATPLFGLGGALLLRVKLAERFAWSSAGSLASAQARIDRGELNVLHASLRSGLALSLESTRAALQLGAGVRAGWLRLSGTPADAEQTDGAHFSALYLGPAVTMGTTLRIAGPVFVALELELSHALRALRAKVQGGNARTLSPWRSSAALGAGVAW